MSAVEYEIRVPDLGNLGPICLSSWLVEEGDEVQAGDRIAELLAGPATFDVSSPISGRLARCLVDEEQPVHAGQVVAVIEGDTD